MGLNFLKLSDRDVWRGMVANVSQSVPDLAPDDDGDTKLTVRYRPLKT